MTNTINLDEELDSIMGLIDSQTANLQQIQIQNLILINEINEIENIFSNMLSSKNENNKKSNKKTKSKKAKEPKLTEKNIKPKEEDEEESDPILSIIDFDLDEESESSHLTKKMLRRQNDRSFHLGYMGEGYVYEELMKFGCFSKINWNAKTDNINNPSITLNNQNKYYIQEDGEHYDMTAEDFDGNKYYIEIKSTSSSNRGCSISRCQKQLAQKLNMNNEKFIIAVVKNVFETPTIDYDLYPNQKLNINHEYDLIKSIYDISTNENIDQNNMYDDISTNQDTKMKSEPMKPKSTAEKKIKSDKVKNPVKKSKVTTKLQSIDDNKKVKPAKSKKNSNANPNVSKMLSNIRAKSERKQKKKKN